jgi:hydroxyacylglutathione hydrolase
MEVHIVPVLADNYSFIVYDEEEGVCGVVDPGESDAVDEVLQSLGLELDIIFVTHFHGDHVGGVRALKEEYECKVLGPGRYGSRIPGLDMPVVEGDRVPFGGGVFEVMEMPGHTLDHVVYWNRRDGILFCGDVLFGAGCGRVMEGSPRRMWYNMERLRGLPDETRVFCGHEYTAQNMMFALSVEPENEDLHKRGSEVMELRKTGRPTVPLNLGEEKKLNPFLRADDAGLMKFCDVKESPAACFAVLRGMKDDFVPPDVGEVEENEAG